MIRGVLAPRTWTFQPRGALFEGMETMQQIDELDSLEGLFAPPAEVSGTVAEVAQQYLATRRRQEEITRQLSEANNDLCSAEWALLSKLDEQGLKSIKVADGAGVAHLIAGSHTMYRL